MTERPRTEDDLRAAYQLAAQDAPDREAVLRAVLAREQPATATRRRRYPLLVPIGAVAAVVLAIGSLVAIVKSASHDTRSASRAAVAPDPQGGNFGATPAAGGIAAGGQSGPGDGASPVTGVAPGTAQPMISGSDGGTGPVIPPPTFPSAGHICRPDEVTLAVAWVVRGVNLTGTVTATNDASDACDLLVKPTVVPLDNTGQPIDVRTVSTDEGKSGPQRLLPGATATSQLTWSFWCGRQLGDTAQVSWGTGTATATSTLTDDGGVVAAGSPVPGPAMACPDNTESAAISSGWFGPLA